MDNINRKVYTDAMDTVHAPCMLADKVKDIENLQVQKIVQTKKKTFKKYRKIAVAAAIAVFFMILFVPGTSFAKYVKEIFTGFWENHEEIGSYVVQNNLYKDEDKHIKVSVEEILSDRVCVQVVVKFEARDDEGKEWLKEYKPVDSTDTRDGISGSLSITPDFMNGMGVTGAYGHTELYEYKGENERYFTLQYLACEQMDKGILHYSLPSGQSKSMEIDINSNIPVYTYDLKAENGKEVSKYYKPEKIRMSKLSIVVYGKDMGLSSVNNTETKNKISEEWIEVSEKEYFKLVKMIKKDGSDMNIGFNASHGGIGKVATEENSGCDCLVLSETLCYLEHYLDENGVLQAKQVVTDFSPEEMAGIRLVTENGDATYWFE